MTPVRLIIFCWLAAACVPVAGASRTWTDTSGGYTIDAELVAFSDDTVVLKRADHELVAMGLKELSDADREYLKSNDAGQLAKKSLTDVQTWSLGDGTKLEGRLVDFTSRDVTIQQRRGRTYVNDRRIENVPEFYQQLLPKIVAHYAKLPNNDQAAFTAWLRQQRGRPQTFHVEGVVLELENGDEYAIPFALLSEADLKALYPSWDEWSAAHAEKDYDEQEDLGFLVRSLAAARQRDAEVQREIALMQLQLQAVQAGATSLWEVTLYPAAGQPRPPAMGGGSGARQSTSNGRGHAEVSGVRRRSRPSGRETLTISVEQSMFATSR